MYISTGLWIYCTCIRTVTTYSHSTHSIYADYVFDGTSPPYAPSAATNPLNLYGISKRDGETAVLGVSGAQSIVLRVPILYGVLVFCVSDCVVINDHRYGPAPNNNDSAVNILLDVVVDQTGKQYRMDHYATRFPTNVLDIADFLVRLTGVSPFCLRSPGSKPWLTHSQHCHPRALFPLSYITARRSRSPSTRCA